MYSCNDTLSGGLPHSDIHGSTPARGSPWLFAACHVLHRLLVPRHPPNALVILDTHDATPQSSVHHAQKPSADSVVRVPSPVANSNRDGTDRLSEDSPGNTLLRTTRSSSHGRSAGRLRDPPRIHPIRSFTTPLNPRRPTVGALLAPECRAFRQPNNNSRSDKSAERRISGQCSVVSGQSKHCRRRTTHQTSDTRAQRRTRT
jgi:hypothetical protein